MILIYYQQLFVANTNPTDVKDIKFPAPVFARFIRIVPKSFNDYNKAALRMEVLGYKTSKYNFIEQYIIPMSNPYRKLIHSVKVDIVKKFNCILC